MTLLLFWIPVLAIALEYLLYHLALFSARNQPLRGGDFADWPRVTVLIPTFNEAATIADKIANVRASDYPADKLDIVVGDDGSEDDTCAIVEALGHANVRVHRSEGRRGKIHVQREILGTIDTPFVLLTDATVRFKPDVLKALVRHFIDPEVGGASARIHVANPRNNWLVDLHRLLFQIQNGQKAGEARLDSAGGLYGQCSMIRLEALGDAPSDVVYEDREFGIRLRKRGYRVRLDDWAEADYLVPETVADFRAQKSRIAGAMTQSISRHRDMLFNGDYGRYGTIIFPEYALFRVLRQPLLAVAALGLLVSLFTVPFPRVAAHAIAGGMAVLLSFWGGSLCLLPYLHDRAGFVRRLVTGIPGVALLAGILALGSLRFLRHGQQAAWQRISRDTPHAPDSGQS